jgi:hypothetical protein
MKKLLVALVATLFAAVAFAQAPATAPVTKDAPAAKAEKKETKKKPKKIKAKKPAEQKYDARPTSSCRRTGSNKGQHELPRFRFLLPFLVPSQERARWLRKSRHPGLNLACLWPVCGSSAPRDCLWHGA